jgi:hypothetical protein
MQVDQAGKYVFTGRVDLALRGCRIVLIDDSDDCLAPDPEVRTWWD